MNMFEVQTLYILQDETHLINIDGKRYDVGGFKVVEEKYCISDMLSLGWDKNFIAQRVFDNEEAAYRCLIRKSAEHYKNLYDQLQKNDKVISELKGHS